LIFNIHATLNGSKKACSEDQLRLIRIPVELFL
jgi:hypothetical protein